LIGVCLVIFTFVWWGYIFSKPTDPKDKVGEHEKYALTGDSFGGLLKVRKNDSDLQQVYATVLRDYVASLPCPRHGIKRCLQRGKVALNGFYVPLLPRRAQLQVVGKLED
jgi:hypothetical protein